MYLDIKGPKIETPVRVFHSGGYRDISIQCLVLYFLFFSQRVLHGEDCVNGRLFLGAHGSPLVGKDPTLQHYILVPLLFIPSIPVRCWNIGLFVSLEASSGLTRQTKILAYSVWGPALNGP